MGKELKNIPVTGNQVLFERGNLSSGSYLYKVISATSPVASGKLIIQ